MATMQGDASPRRRTHTQVQIRDVLLLQRKKAPQGRAPRGNMARQRLEALPEAEKGTGKGTMPMAPANQSQRLPKRWKDKRKCVSKPPTTRNERESELVASLFGSFSVSTSCAKQPFFPLMAACVLGACPWLNNIEFCQLCTLSRCLRDPARTPRQKQRSKGAPELRTRLTPFGGPLNGDAASSGRGPKQPKSRETRSQREKKAPK